MVGLKHSFQSAVSDGADTSLVRPSNWNADHSGIEWYRTAADHTNSTTTPTNVSGLAFALAASEVVNFELTFMSYAAAATTGAVVAFTGPASPSLTHFAGYGLSSASAFLAVGQSLASPAFGTNITFTGGSATATDPRLHTIRGFIVNGANAGTVQVQIGSEVGGSLVTVRRGALLVVYRS